MIKLFHKLMTAALPVLLCGTLLTGCTDDKYNKINDLFQPRFVLEEPEVKGNSISLVWYKVNDAVSYTVEYYLDQYHSNLFMVQETTVPQLFVDDIPYGTTYYIRVRSNAADEANNSSVELHHGFYRETAGIYPSARRCFKDRDYRNNCYYPLEERL